MINEKNISTISAELYEYLNILGDFYINSIPKDIYNKIDNLRDKNYKNKYTKELTSIEGVFSNDTINILLAFELKYWLNKDEKLQKMNLYKNNENKFLTKQYINSKNEPNINIQIESDSSILEKSETLPVINDNNNLFKKFYLKIKAIFKK